MIHQADEMGPSHAPSQEKAQAQSLSGHHHGEGMGAGTEGS